MERSNHSTIDDMGYRMNSTTVPARIIIYALAAIICITYIIRKAQLPETRRTGIPYRQKAQAVIRVTRLLFMRKMKCGCPPKRN